MHRLNICKTFRESVKSSFLKRPLNIYVRQQNSPPNFPNKMVASICRQVNWVRIKFVIPLSMLQTHQHLHITKVMTHKLHLLMIIHSLISTQRLCSNNIMWRKILIRKFSLKQKVFNKQRALSNMLKTHITMMKYTKNSNKTALRNPLIT